MTDGTEEFEAAQASEIEAAPVAPPVDQIGDAAFEVPLGATEGPLEEDDEAGRQRRQNVRVDVQLPIQLSMSGRTAPGRTRDMSATGIGFSTRLPVEIDQRGEVTVTFEDWQINKSFTVRFVKPILAGYQVGAQFEDLTQDERERLVKEVFDVQRRQLRGMSGGA